MKKQTILLGAFLLVTLASFSQMLISKPANSEINFMGTQGQSTIFQVKINNPENGAFTITIRDKAGILLHRETVKGQKQVRKYALNPDEMLDEPLIVEVEGTKTVSRDVYEVTNNVIGLRTITVKRVK